MTSSTMKIHYNVLREMLRIPQNVVIVSVNQDPANSSCCVVELAGELPSGELTAEYTFEHTTIVKFQGFVKVTQ